MSTPEFHVQLRDYRNTVDRVFCFVGNLNRSIVWIVLEVKNAHTPIRGMK